jgi:GNAT superfamily N-acetyltransferase
MNVEIRAAVEADAEGVISLYREFTRYLSALGDEPEGRLTLELFRLQGFGPYPAFHALVAESDGVIIGYLLYHFGYDADRATRVMHIVDLYADGEHRRHGVGSALMARACSICRDDGLPEMLWSVYKPNRPAKRFYERLGAKVVDDLDFMHLEFD